MNTKIIYDEYTTLTFNEEEFNNLFDNTFENREYVITGVLGLWDGKYKTYSSHVYHSLKDALLATTEDCIVVKEGKYGRLLVDSYHHDGVNKFEIKELTSKGSEMMNNNYSKDICQVHGATRNVKFVKNYL